MTYVHRGNQSKSGQHKDKKALSERKPPVIASMVGMSYT